MRRSRKGGHLKTRYRGEIEMIGPASLEQQTRAKLRARLDGELSECDLFASSGWAERIAEKIASESHYVAKPSRKVATLHIRQLVVEYRNPPGPWKYWILIENDRSIDVMGQIV